MKIAIDARWIFKEISGIGNYTENLIRVLARSTSHNKYLLLFDDEQRRDIIVARTGVDRADFIETAVLSYGVFTLRNQLLLPRLLRNNEVDIYHAPNYMIPLLGKPCTYIVTIHDIIPLRHPEYTPQARKTKLFGLYSWIMRRVVKKADHILTDSLYSKQDLMDFFSLDATEISAVYPGIDALFTGDIAINQNRSFKKRYHVAGKLVIYVGRQDPYKNILGLVQAFRRVLSEDKVNAKLLLVGPEDFRYPDVHRFIKQYKLQDSIFFTGYLSSEDLVQLYCDADILALPSRYEGFGLPVIEAFATNTAVVASQTTSLPEVVGDAGLLVNPDNVIAIKEALTSLATDDNLRLSLIEKGKERLAQFNWMKACSEIEKIYEETMLISKNDAASQ